jgi:hypothetical protein
MLVKRTIIIALVIVLSMSLLAVGQQPTQATTPAKVQPTKPKVANVKPPVATTVAPSQKPTAVGAPVKTTTTVEPAMVAPHTMATPQAIAPTTALATPGVQQPSPQPTVTTAQSPVAREDAFVNEKNFKGKVFEIKHREPGVIIQAIKLLGSGFKGAQMSQSEDFKTITVRDFPENIAAIEEAIKRLDTPQAPRPDIEFRIQVLIASNTTLQDGVGAYPQDLKNLLDQLLATLKYTNYALMFSANHRSKEGGQGVRSNGILEPKLFNVSVPQGNQVFYDYGIGSISLDSTTTAGPTVQLGMFEFSLRIPLMIGGTTSPIQYQNVGFRSPVSLREGEKVVVGTTTMGDKGLIVVLSAKVNK